MAGIGLWSIDNNAPAKLSSGAVGLERDLEEWIEHDPALLESGLVIVGRQLRLEGGPLDLLALDQQGRWVLIEIKRGRLRREVIAQAIDYASCLSAIDAESLRRHCDGYLEQRGGGTLDALLNERGRTIDDDEDLELIIYLVGAGADPGLERMVEFLGENFSLAIRVVTFSVFNDQSGGTLLAREIHEQAMMETPGTTRSGAKRSAPSVEEMLTLADNNGIGEFIRPIYDGTTEAGFYARPTKRGMMFTPQQNKSRTLIFVPIDRPGQMQDGKLCVWIFEELFNQIYSIRPSELEEALGVIGKVFVDTAGAKRIAAGLSKLFQQPS